MIFYKAVRADYTSVHAPPGLRCTYRVGKTYHFHPALPAHVFNASNDKEAWFGRPESNVAARVLICEGITEEKMVPCVLRNENWEKSFLEYETKLVSTDFKVIGEVKRPKDVNTHYFCTARLLLGVTRAMALKLKDEAIKQWETKKGH